MITIIKTDVVENKDGETLKTVEYRGLSSEKPTENVGNGSIYICVDTGDVYIYDLENEQWTKM